MKPIAADFLIHLDGTNLMVVFEWNLTCTFPGIYFTPFRHLARRQVYCMSSAFFLLSYHYHYLNNFALSFSLTFLTTKCSEEKLFRGTRVVYGNQGSNLARNRGTTVFSVQFFHKAPLFAFIQSSMLFSLINFSRINPQLIKLRVEAESVAPQIPSIWKQQVEPAYS